MRTDLLLFALYPVKMFLSRGILRSRDYKFDLFVNNAEEKFAFLPELDVDLPTLFYAELRIILFYSLFSFYLTINFAIYLALRCVMPDISSSSSCLTTSTCSGSTI